MKKICQYCGKEFDTDCKYRKYCGDRCAKEVSKIQSSIEYRENNEIKRLVCKECGEKFDFTYKHRIREFCCIDCRNSYLRRMRKKQLNTDFLLISRKWKKRLKPQKRLL